MKKNLISILALILALASLALSAFAAYSALYTREKLEEQIAWQGEINEHLSSRIDTLVTQLDGMESGAVMTSCNLFVNSWTEEDGALTLTDAYLEVQLSADAQIDIAQLVLMHNGTETSRVEIPLESTEAAGLYHRSLTDTWFLLPKMADDDNLDLYLLVTLDSGDQMVSAATSWYRTDGTLHSVVG